MANRRDYTGKKYGHLTLLQFSRGRGGGRHALWVARCDCGTVKEVIAKEVERGTTKTCGKCQYHQGLLVARRGQTRGGTSIPAAQRFLYGRYVYSAHKRGHEWGLEPTQFLNLTTQDCAYCGDAPGKKVRNSQLEYNGIDRIDNEKGYTLDNSVPCCSACNKMKGSYSAPEFIEKVIKIYSMVKDALISGAERA